MFDERKMACTNCEREVGGGGAGGLCNRCYQYQRRTARLPPADLLRGRDITEQLAVRIDSATLKAAKKAAKAEGIQLSEYVRRALRGGK